MDFYFTWLPLLSGLILRLPSSALRGFQVCRPTILVGLKFLAFAVICMLLLAVGALCFGLTGMMGWFGSSGGHSQGLHGGEKFLEHCHHVFHLLRVLFVQRICNFGNYHGL